MPRLPTWYRPIASLVLLFLVRHVRFCLGAFPLPRPLGHRKHHLEAQGCECERVQIPFKWCTPQVPFEWCTPSLLPSFMPSFMPCLLHDGLGADEAHHAVHSYGAQQERAGSGGHGCVGRPLDACLGHSHAPLSSRALWHTSLIQTFILILT